MTTYIHKRKQGIARVLLTLVLLLFFTVPVSASSIPGPTDDFYVDDFAGLLNDDCFNYIMNIAVELEEKTGAQVVVATVESLDGSDIETYANEMFRKYGIGDAKENNGVLILLAHGDRKIRIEVGYGLEGAINDAKAGRILDNYVIPYLKDDRWDEGILNGFDAVVQEIAKEYDVEISSNLPVEYERHEGTSDNTETYLYVALLVLVIIIAIFSKNSGSGGYGGSTRSYGGGYSGGGSSFSGGGGSSGGGGASRGF